ncbi:MAG TPA: Flp pilus assembly protein CpaB [Terriglobales bacterium]|nr:Flp pilus assembly protein CpaB [Terriglobales bacterium]
MNRTRLMIIGLLALALGAFVSFSVYRTLQARTTGSNEPGMDVVVAANDIAVGNKLQEKDLKVVRFPAGNVPAGASSRVSQVVGRGVVTPIARGEFILPSKLAAENAGAGLPGLIPPGMRAVSVRVNEVVAVAGFVVPGTRVDVLLTGNPGGADQQTTTVLENVAVIAAGQKLERNSAGEPQSVPVITLLVSPEDAQRLTLASTEGRIQLSLRNPLDTKAADLSPVRTPTLYKSGVPISLPVTRTAVKKVKAVVTPPAPSVYTIETIRGNEKKEVKLDSE